MHFIVYDFETSGRSSRFDQILQAGMICYDSELKEISRLNLKSRLNPDTIPSLGALRVNKLLISDLLEEKNTSYQMIKLLRNYLTQYKPVTFLGYNSIHFDEEFLRQSLWEFFQYPYLTSTNNNLRGDVFNLVTMSHAFEPNSINVEKNDEGKMLFKLESIASINNIKIENAHEAISDVEATKGVLEIIKNNSPSLYLNFIENTKNTKITNKIKQEEIFSHYGYYFNNHYYYLMTYLFDHPIYNNYLIAFDLKFDPRIILDLDPKTLKNLYYDKKFEGKNFNCFRKLKLNKQPAILNYKYSIQKYPYKDIEVSEIKKRVELIKNSNLINELQKILIDEAEKYENICEFEEETIYSENISFQDKTIMEDFDKIKWEEKWKFASKFKDPRLQFFAARHIYRNHPDFLPKKVFKRVHQKISERFNSLRKEKFTTLPSAMEEADSFSLLIEEEETSSFYLNQLDQYNMYINFLNSYYNDPNPSVIKFDKSLSKKLFC